MELPRFFLLMMITLLSFTALASAGSPQAVAAVITKEDNGKEITVPEGEIFEVRLEQSGGTGFLWQIAGLDQTHLKVLESSQLPLKQRGEIVGGPLMTTWKIKALKAGQTNLKILLYRSWEGPEKAADNFQVKIQIR
ncbi:exported hypothetical protein [Syntrophobacter sp. SbD1]|nr:exported hypothetical protein [Syntrophobacter sp. SbD1]